MNVTITTIPEYGGILAGWTLILAVSKTTGRAPSEIRAGGAEPPFPEVPGFGPTGETPSHRVRDPARAGAELLACGEQTPTPRGAVATIPAPRGNRNISAGA